MIREQIAFKVTFRNVDAADPRCGDETELMFSGVWFDGEDGDEKEIAIMHCAFNVCPAAEIIKKYGKVHPIPRTFKLISKHTPSDQRL